MALGEGVLKRRINEPFQNSCCQKSQAHVLTFLRILYALWRGELFRQAKPSPLREGSVSRETSVFLGAEPFGERIHDHLMVVQMGQAGNGDDADRSYTADIEREPSAAHGELHGFQTFVFHR